MKYLLSEKEYQDLLKAKSQRLAVNDEELQTLCTKICNELPVFFWSNNTAKPWGCKIQEEEFGHEWYCDECPVQKICPNEFKEWSR